MTLFSALAETSLRVSSTPSRLAKRDEIARFARTLDTTEVALAVLYLSGETPQGKLNVGHGSLHDARRTQPASVASLSLHDVDAALSEIAAIKGQGAGARRVQCLTQLFSQATPAERDFLDRLIVGELRQGALRALVLEAVAAAAGVDVMKLRRAMMSAGSLAPVAQAALGGGAAALERFAVCLMQPVLPMLSQSAGGTDEALDKLGHAAFEWKLDGARIQVHKSGDEIRIYTRNLNEVTARVPEIVAAVRASRHQSLILDGEAIALRADGTPLSFQVTMRRFGRQLDVDALHAELPLSVFVFDCLWCDGRVMVDRPAAERHAVLAAAIEERLLVPRIVTADREEAARFFEDAIAHGHEGVMAKSLTAPYEAGRRGAGWLKIKRANTLDLVVLAVEWGHGRRQGRLSNLHLGARDPATGGFVMLGKTFKGLTDQMLEWQTEALQRLATHHDDWTVHVRPELVVEVAFNEIQASPRYPAGLALRFARVKGYRPDKPAMQADTIETVRKLYDAQLHALPR